MCVDEWIEEPRGPSQVSWASLGISVWPPRDFARFQGARRHVFRGCAVPRFGTQRARTATMDHGPSHGHALRKIYPDLPRASNSRDRDKSWGNKLLAGKVRRQTKPTAAHRVWGSVQMSGYGGGNGRGRQRAQCMMTATAASCCGHTAKVHHGLGLFLPRVLPEAVTVTPYDSRN